MTADSYTIHRTPYIIYGYDNIQNGRSHGRSLYFGACSLNKIMKMNKRRGRSLLVGRLISITFVIAFTFTSLLSDYCIIKSNKNLSIFSNAEVIISDNDEQQCHENGSCLNHDGNTNDVNYSNERDAEIISELKDNHTMCHTWAVAGECIVNPNYMTFHCQKSCHEVAVRNENLYSSEMCGLYLAESSIPNSGLGMYTSKNIPHGENIFHPEIVINIVDYWDHNNLRKEFRQLQDLKRKRNETGETKTNGNFHPLCSKWAKAGECKKNPVYMWKNCKNSCDRHDDNGGDGDDDDDDDDDEHEWLPQSYVWDARNTYSMYEAHNVDSLIPGLGMLANSHTGLVNSQMRSPTVQPVVRDGKDYGVGAYSTFHNLSYYASKHIPAGMELFVEYGDSWFEGREEKFGPIPLSDHFARADGILSRFLQFTSTDTANGNDDSNRDNDFEEGLYDFIRNELISNERLQMALPSNISNPSIPRPPDVPSTALLSVPNVHQSIEWLEQNGRCLDNIRPDVSKLAHAGRGAFATRRLNAGQVIAPAPLVHIHREDLHMYKEKKEQDGIINNSDDADYERIQHYGEQLLLNYCYGHRKSSLLLFPYSPVINFINHNSNAQDVNAKIQWSTLPNHKSEWMYNSVDQVMKENNAGLIMEFVASRDIEEGEEIFIDYGSAWEEAWDNHVNSWIPPSMDDENGHISLDILNQEEVIRTLPEQSTNPYPPNALMVCHLPKEVWEDEDDDYDFGDEVIEWYSTAGMYEKVDYTRPCEILKRYQNDDNDDEHDKVLHKARFKLAGKRNMLVDGIPRRAIKFLNRPYTSDQFLEGAFRHEIHIPDDLFPKSWIDLDETKSSKENEHDLTSNEDDTFKHVMNDDSPYEQCRFFVAESSIPNAGLGIYTGVDMKKGEYTQPDIVIHTVDWERQAKLRCKVDSSKCGKPEWLFTSYEWNSHMSHGNRDARQVSVNVPGMGALANYHTALESASMRRPTKDGGGLHRGKDPGAGAISIYNNMRFEIFKSLSAGSEIFISYGEDWLLQREEKLGKIPFAKDFNEADRLIKRFLHFSDKHPTDDEYGQSLWSFIREEVLSIERVQNALPESIVDTKQAGKTGTALHSVPNFIRSIEWLKENGRCLDDIRQGPSTIPQAGRGAFARRDLKKGEVVSTAPMIHIERDVLQILEEKVGDNGNKEIIKVGDQLQLNYCYGHTYSSLLLCPYSPVTNVINHNSQDSVNVKIKWSSMPFHHSLWTEMSFDEVMTQQKSGLIMDFVAIRDIEEGEEIFIDYGNQWQKAWDNHVRNWKPLAGAKHYVSSWEFSSLAVPVRTAAEQSQSPYPDNIVVVCFVPNNILADGQIRKGKFGEERIWFHNDEDLLYFGDNASPCDILDREANDTRYTVEVDMPNHGIVLVGNVPRSFINFVDRAYTTDEFIPGAFRHEIHIPDDVFPEAWMNLK